jgi:hypothetical protein
MAITQLSAVDARKRSSAVIRVNFKNEFGVAMVPKSATWTLTNENGVVVNSRRRVVISPLASSVDIRLSGLDLAVSKGKTVQNRVFTVEAVYDSSFESDIPLNDACIFTVENLVGVPDSG